MNWREQGEEYNDHLEGYYGNLVKKCSWTELGSWNRKRGSGKSGGIKCTNWL